MEERGDGQQDRAQQHEREQAAETDVEADPTHLGRAQPGVAVVEPGRQQCGADDEHDSQFHEGRHGTIHPCEDTGEASGSDAALQCSSAWAICEEMLRAMGQRPPLRVTPTYIGLGSNLGDARATLAGAVAALADLGEVASVSALYETDPVGYLDQPPFLNAAARLDTVLEPL